jgi:hypothetical protein
MSAFIEVTDRHGRRRHLQPGEIIKDGERVFIPHQFMDNAARPRVFTDAVPTQRGFVRGYAHVADAMDVSQDVHTAAAQAYAEKVARTETARRNISDGTALDAKQAYDERSARIANAWRSKDNAAHTPHPHRTRAQPLMRPTRTRSSASQGGGK